MITSPTFGSDIEVIVNTLEGRPFPICGIVGGTKDKPRNLGSGYYIQEDNVLLEFNIPVAKSGKEFVDFVITGLRRASKELPPSLMVAKSESTAVYPAAYINHIEQAQTFGCEPDYNAWTVEQNPRPFAKNACLRSAAAHVHIGWENPTPEDQIALIKWADVCVSLPSVWESSDRSRRELYGKAGAFRPKDYGVEHRVLDNYWIFDAELVMYVYQRYYQAIMKVNSGVKIPEVLAQDVQRAINTYDMGLAKATHKTLLKLEA